MTDVRIEKFAELITQYSIKVKPGDNVIIRSTTAAKPLINALYAKILSAGGFPHLMLKFPETDEILFQNASDEQLQATSPAGQFMVENFDALIMIKGEINTRALSGFDPKRIMLDRKAEGPLMHTLMKRAAAGEVRWVSTIFPTQAYAQDADMSLKEFEDFAYNAYMPDMDDPIGYWQNISRQQDKIIDWFKGKKEVHVKGEGTDLRLSIEGRTFINCCGDKNLPDGEIYTGPVEDSVEGYIRFSYPAMYQGNEFDGVRLWFEKGRIVKAEADKNEKMLQQAIETDEGSHYLGEFAIGTNNGLTRSIKQILFDEKIGGSIHVAIGNGYPDTGSKNVSVIHWDFIYDLKNNGEIWVDGELLHKNGRFVINF